MGLAAGIHLAAKAGLPNGWPIVEIGSLHPFITSGSRGWAAYYSDHGAPFVRITNPTRESIRLDLDDLRYVRLPDTVREGTRTELREGDVLVSITADTGIVGCVSSNLPSPAYVNQHLALVRFEPSKADGRFVAYQLAGDRGQSLFRALTDTGAKAGMSLLTIRALPILLPPLTEQRAIASALDEVDSLVAALERLINKKRGLRIATAHQLLSGEFRLPGFEGGAWEECRLGDVADIDTDNLASSTRPDYAFRYISLEDVREGRLAGWSEVRFEKAPSRARRRIRRSDVLLSTVRPNLRSHLLFTEEGDDWVCSTGFSVLRCLPDVADARYVFLQLFSRPVERQIEALLVGSNYPAINAADVRSLKVLMPSPREQAAIAGVLLAMDAEIDMLEARVAKTRDLKAAMAQELLWGRTRLV